jgi:hypothetical protein
MFIELWKQNHTSNNLSLFLVHASGDDSGIICAASIFQKIMGLLGSASPPNRLLH